MIDNKGFFLNLKNLRSQTVRSPDNPNRSAKNSLAPDGRKSIFAF